MSLLDRVRDRLTHAPAGLAWDDEDPEDLSGRTATLVAAWDPEPDDRRLAESRATVLGAFAAASAGRVDKPQGALDGAVSQAAAGLGIRRGGRRPALVLVAAVLLLSMSLGTVAASGPGGPLYGLRVASEGLLLPGSADDRSRAQVARLDARIAEASAADVRGDAGAVVAALRAYARIATEASIGSQIDRSTAARLALRVRAQLVDIALVGGGQPALDEVRAEAQVAARALLGALGEPADGPGPGPGPSGPDEPSPGDPPSTSGSQAPGTPGGSGGPGASTDPGRSASPDGSGPSPSPAGTGGPKATSGPSKTSGPGRTPGPSLTPGPKQAPAPSTGTTPAATPQASGDPSATVGDRSGPGSPGDGG